MSSLPLLSLLVFLPWLGAALIERDLLNEKIAILEANRPLARRRLKS